jgi:Fe-S cluster assembly protein SufD
MTVLRSAALAVKELEMGVAVMKTKGELALTENFQSVASSLPGGPVVGELRRKAMATFGELGLPHRRIETWKYTDLRSVFKEPAPPAVGDAAKLTVADLIVALGPFMEIDAARIVFVNGEYRKTLSNLDGAESVSVTPLADNFGTFLSVEDDAVAALNTAFATDGARIEVPDGTVLDKPIMIVALAAGKTPQLTTVRHSLKIGAKAKVNVLELFVTLPGSASDGQVNTMSDVVVGDLAELAHTKVASDTGRNTHLSNLSVRLGTDSTYRGFQLTCGVALARNQVAATFSGEGGKFDLSGAFTGRGGDHVDTTLVVDHAVPHCESRELFTGVLDGHARGIFQGKVIVRPDAQKTDGKQMAKVMMLSPDAEFDSKPELEIYADDVVCGHGSTAAQIDDDLLFYCQARGIPAEVARALLVESFIGEAIDKVTSESVRDALTATVRTWLAGSQS